jgi:hypothetical protein
MLQNFIYPLMNQGYIDSVESELDRRTHIYFPVIELKQEMFSRSQKKNNLFEAYKMNIIDPLTFPNKAYVTSRIQGVLNYYSKEGVTTSLCGFSGSEISIDELVDQYYSKPEDYFELFPRPLALPAPKEYSDDSDETESTEPEPDPDPEEAASKKAKAEAKTYSDYLIDGIPIWRKENRGMTDEEGQAYKTEVERLKGEREAGE